MSPIQRTGRMGQLILNLEAELDLLTNFGGYLDDELPAGSKPYLAYAVRQHQFFPAFQFDDKGEVPAPLVAAIQRLRLELKMSPREVAFWLIDSPEELDGKTRLEVIRSETEGGETLADEYVNFVIGGP